jgi:nicotinamide phosphoribosyltransferase
LIYGDSISLERAKTILKGLELKGFSSANIVFGVGSFTYQYVSRDTFGTAIKATWGQVNGEARELFKDPKTDNGIKKSACGLIRVEKENGHYVMHDHQTWEQEVQGLLATVFEDGKLIRFQTLADIRERLHGDRK